MSLPVTSSQTKFSAIESLRGWAALGVLVHHVAFFPPPHYIGPRFANTIAEAGTQGVSLFFAISAFTLTKSFNSRNKEPSPLLAFYLRRLFRIAPLFFAWLVARLIADFSRGQVHGPAEIVLNASFVFNFFPSFETGIVWTSWTIGLEVAFYAFFPFIAKRVTSISRAAAFLILSLAGWMLFRITYFQFHPTETTESLFYKFSFFRHLHAFALGMICYYIYEQHKDRLRSSRVWGSILLFGIIIVGESALVFGNELDHDIILLIQSLTCSGILLGLLAAPNRFFVNRLSGLFGQCSYSIYLNHTAFIFALIPFYNNYYTAGGYHFYKFAICCILTTLAVLAFSWTTYRVIEEPAIQAGRNLIARARQP